MGDFAQRENHLQIGHGGHLALEKCVAGLDFLRGWFVLRWNTAYRIDNQAVFQFQTIIRPRSKGAFGKSEFFDCCVKQVSCVIAGKRPTGLICAAQTGSQTSNHKAGIVIAERVNRAIVPLGVFDPLFADEVMQARAEIAIVVRIYRLWHEFTYRNRLRNQIM